MKRGFYSVRANAQFDALVVHRALVSAKSKRIRDFQRLEFSVELKFDRSGSCSFDNGSDTERGSQHAWKIAHFDGHPICEGNNLLAGVTIDQIQRFQNFGASQEQQFPVLGIRSSTMKVDALSFATRPAVASLKAKESHR
jgi:hypothetical protein